MKTKTHPTTDKGILDRVLDPLTQTLTPAAAHALVKFRAGPEVQARIAELGEKCNEGQLSPKERAEYEAYVQVGRSDRHPSIEGPPLSQISEVLMASLRAAVRRRARMRCEYCLLPEAVAPIRPFQMEHVVARKHGGPTTMANLALACNRCNLFKGSDLTGIDKRSRKITRLFHPRKMKWSRHFRWEGPFLIGRTAVGRTTVAVLQMNQENRVDLRQTLIDEGEFP